MSSTFSGDETAPFFGFLGASAALVFSCMGAAYGTAKSGVYGCDATGAGDEIDSSSCYGWCFGIYGLIIGVIISYTTCLMAMVTFLLASLVALLLGISNVVAEESICTKRHLQTRAMLGVPNFLHNGSPN